MKAPKLSKIACRIPSSQVHKTKISITSSNSQIPSANNQNNSEFLKQFINKKEINKQIGQNYNIIKTHCPKFPSNLKHIFSSDKRRAKAVNYVKKYRFNKSQIADKSANTQRVRRNNLFDVSPIHGNAILSQKNIHNQPNTSRCNFSNMYQYSTPNVFANYTSRAPQNNRIISLTKGRYNYFDKSLDDDVYDTSYMNMNSNTKPQITLAGSESRRYVMKEPSEEKEIESYHYNDYEHGDESSDDGNNKNDYIQTIYSRNDTENKNSLIYKPLDIHLPDVSQSSFTKKKHLKSNLTNKFNGYIILEINNGNKINEYECPKNGNWKKINDYLLNDNVSLCGKFLQFIDLNDYEHAKQFIRNYEMNQKEKINTRSIGTNTFNKEHKLKLVEEKVIELYHLNNNLNNFKKNIIDERGETISYISQNKPKQQTISTGMNNDIKNKSQFKVDNKNELSYLSQRKRTKLTIENNMELVEIKAVIDKNDKPVQTDEIKLPINEPKVNVDNDTSYNNNNENKFELSKNEIQFICDKVRSNTKNIEIQTDVYEEQIQKEVNDMETNTETINTNTISINEEIQYILIKEKPKYFNTEIQTEIETKDKEINTDKLILTTQITKNETLQYISQKDNINKTNSLNQNKLKTPKHEPETPNQNYQSNSNQNATFEHSSPPTIETSPHDKETDLPKNIIRKTCIRIIPKEEAELLNIVTVEPTPKLKYSFKDTDEEIIIPSASVKDKIRRIHSAYGLTTYSRQASSLLDEFTEPKILTVLSHKPVQSKKKKKFTYNDFDENFTKEKELEKETQQNVIALRGKALLFRQKLKKQGANKGA
jgi:hypothetical protein